jgi:hypothetical protein
MKRILSKNSQSAQGTVEFALVLPILLLLILGIFAVGHIIFTYAFVLSASREAARYGAAVGTTTAGRIYYQDCDGIRETATRVGGVAGVQAGNINITYDNGPEKTQNRGSCPIGGTGPNVNLGDRIYVEILLPYKPIVPIINFPEFTLRANTARTIIKSVSVGQSPDAENHCRATWTTLNMSPRPSVVGQNVTFTIGVTADRAVPPTAANSFSVVDINENLICRGSVTNGVGSCTAPIFSAALHYITARFEGTITGDCYDPSEAFDIPQQVNISATRIASFTTTPNPSFNSEAVQARVQVSATFPGGGFPQGSVNIFHSGSLLCAMTLDAAGVGTCTIYPTTTSTSGSSDRLTLLASYAGNADYQASSTSIYHNVYIPTPTFIYTPTLGPTATSTPIPTLSASCPVIVNNINFGAQTDGFVLSVRNPNESIDVHVISFSLEWPTLPTAKLQQFRFATDSSISCTNQNNVCMWWDNSGLNPPSVSVNSTDKTKWKDAAAILTAGQTKEMRLVFGHTLPNGAYKLRVLFNNNCTISIDTDRNLIPQ